MAGLLTAFLTGAATQANAQITEGKKLQADRDKRREEQADALQLYMDQNTFKSSLDEAAAIATEARGLKDYGAKKEIDAKTDTATFATNAGVTYGYSSKLQAQKAAYDAQDKAAAANAASQANAPLIKMFNDALGKFPGAIGQAPKAIDTGGKGPTLEAAAELTQAPAGKTEVTPSDTFYAAKIIAEAAQANPVTKDTGRALADAFNTKITQDKEKNKYLGKPLEFPGGDPYKALSESINAKTMNGSGIANSSFYLPTDKVKVRDSAHNQAVGDAQAVIKFLGESTRTTDEATGVKTNMPNLSPVQAAIAAETIATSKAIILRSPTATPEQKQEAAKAIDTALRLTGVTREEMLSNPDLKVVFDDDFKSAFNALLPQQSSASITRVSTLEEAAKLPKGTEYIAPDALTTPPAASASSSQYPKFMTNGKARATITNASQEANAISEGFR